MKSKIGRPKKIVPIDMILPGQSVAAIARHIDKKGKVNIGGLGVFEIVDIAPKKLYHNMAKKKITTKGYKKLKYTPASTIKSFINQ